MRHRKSGHKLGRDSAPRKAMMANLTISLFDKERIRTTLPKAKALRSFAERLITKAKADTLHARRNVARVVHDKVVLAKVFSTLSPRYADRPGGYTRIYKIGYRKGDGAEMAIIELVDRPDGMAPESSGGGKKLIERDETAAPETTSEETSADSAAGTDDSAKDD
jgi:large subunit ribosomal protein L17